MGGILDTSAPVGPFGDRGPLVRRLALCGVLLFPLLWTLSQNLRGVGRGGQTAVFIATLALAIIVLAAIDWRAAVSSLSRAPGAQAAAKVLIARVAFQTKESVRDYSADLIARRRASEEGREGMSAFLEKRPPAWM